MRPRPLAIPASNAATAGAAAKLAIAVPVLLLLALVAAFFMGIHGSDDISYARRAYAFLDPNQGMNSLSHHDGRVGMTIPLAGVFAVFGASVRSLVLLPLVASVATVVLVGAIARSLHGPQAGLFAAGIYATFPATASLATLYFPEPLVNLELAAAALVFLSTRERRGSAALRHGLTGLLIGCAYLTAEAGALMLVVLGAYLVATGTLRREHCWIACGFLVVVSGEMLGHALLHGSPLYRYSLGGRYTLDPMLIAANANLGYRLFKAYPSLLLFPNVEFGIHGWLFLAGAAYGVFRIRRASLLLLWAGVLFAFFNFMTVSLREYVVLPAAARLIVPVCLPLAVLAGMACADAWTAPATTFRWRRIALGALLAAAGAVSAAALEWGIRQPEKTTLLAHNVELAAGHLKDHDAVVLLADGRSLSLARIYRRFKPADTYSTLEQAPAILAGQAADAAGKPVFALLNMPALREKELTGSVYYSRDSGAVDTSAAEAAVRRHCQIVYVGRREYGSTLLDRLFGAGTTQRLLGIHRTMDRRPANTEVQLYRCDAAKRPGEGSPR